VNSRYIARRRPQQGYLHRPQRNNHRDPFPLVLKLIHLPRSHTNLPLVGIDPRHPSKHPYSEYRHVATQSGDNSHTTATCHNERKDNSGKIGLGEPTARNHDSSHGTPRQRHKLLPRPRRHHCHNTATKQADHDARIDAIMAEYKTPAVGPPTPVTGPDTDGGTIATT